MSTRSDATYDDTSNPRTDATTTDPSTVPEPASDASTTRDGPTTERDALTSNDVPWTQRCKRQFDTTDHTRMRNLNDDANHAMHDGI